MRVMEFCVKELSKKNTVTTDSLESSPRRNKDPALWSPFRSFMGKKGVLWSPQEIAKAFNLHITTVQRNLREMHEAGWLEYVYKEDNGYTRWYSLPK